MKIDIHLEREPSIASLQEVVEDIVGENPEVSVYQPHPLLLRIDCPNITDYDCLDAFSDTIAPKVGKAMIRAEHWEFTE